MRYKHSLHIFHQKQSQSISAKLHWNASLLFLLLRVILTLHQGYISPFCLLQRPTQLLPIPLQLHPHSYADDVIFCLPPRVIRSASSNPLFSLYSPFILHGRAPAASSGPEAAPARCHHEDLALCWCALRKERKGKSHYIGNEKTTVFNFFLPLGVPVADLPAGVSTSSLLHRFQQERWLWFELRTVQSVSFLCASLENILHLLLLLLRHIHFGSFCAYGEGLTRIETWT